MTPLPEIYSQQNWKTKSVVIVWEIEWLIVMRCDRSLHAILLHECFACLNVRGVNSRSGLSSSLVTDMTLLLGHNIVCVIQFQHFNPSSRVIEINNYVRVTNINHLYSI